MADARPNPAASLFGPGALPAWAGYLLALLLAPLLFDSSSALTVLCNIGTVMIFALAYNMLLGQGGMLSFGHAVYSGLGAFCAAHAMNLAGSGLSLPVVLVPLAGGAAGMVFGMVFGYLTTRKAGTTFAMITLGIGELVFASALMFDGFFGGEGGIMTDRVYGSPVLGISFGRQIEVYYLIAFWLFLSTMAMYGFTRTPLGRIINAVRDNPERAAFIGYDVRRVRYLVLVLSAFFAGISGALAAINFEVVTAEHVSAGRSAMILLFTFIGGTAHFFGPMIGAAVGVLLTVVLSDFTRAWQVYLGVFFMLIVMYAPGGLAGIMMAVLRLARRGMLARVLPAMLRVLAAALVLLAGAVMLIEMTYHVSLQVMAGSELRLFGIGIDTSAFQPWAIAAGLVTGGMLLIRRSKPGFIGAWAQASAIADTRVQKDVA